MAIGDDACDCLLEVGLLRFFFEYDYRVGTHSCAMGNTFKDVTSKSSLQTGH